ELASLNLVGGCQGKRVYKSHVSGYLEVRKLGQAPRDDVTREPLHVGRFGLGIAYQAGQHFVPPYGVGNGGYSRRLDGRVLQKRTFDFDGGNGFATAPNDVLLAIHEMQIALSVAPNDVAGVEPAIFPGFVSGLWLFKIAGKETEAGIVSGVAYQQFALVIRAHRFACIIDDAHLDIGLFLAEATGSDKAWLAVGNDDGA